MKTKRIKPQPIASEAEFVLTVNAAAELQAEMMILVTRCDAEVVEIQNAYATAIGRLSKEIEAHACRAEQYADANRKLLLKGDRKSAEVGAAVFGWRTGTKAVKVSPKTVSEDMVIRALKAFGFEAYVRTKEEIAKDKIIADAQLFPVDGKEVHCLPKPAVQHNETVSSVAMVAISDLGLKITQTETFFIEPKATSGETIKAPAA